MIIVGERINTSRKQINEAVTQRNAEFIKNEAVKQSESGANYIDINAGTFVSTELECSEWLIKTVQEVVDKPLCLDSPNPDALSHGLGLCKQKPMINSISNEPGRYEKIIPLIKKFDTDIVALCIGENGMPNTAEERINVGTQLIKRLLSDGVEENKIFVDPLIVPLGTDFKQGLYVIQTLQSLRQQFKNIHFICGLSNISFGLPNRKLINQQFLVTTMCAGLDAVILDPLDKKIMANLYTAETILGKDEYCMNYINAFREGKLDFEK